MNERITVIKLPSLRVARNIRKTSGDEGVKPSDLRHLSDNTLRIAFQRILDENYGENTLRLLDKKIELLFSVAAHVELHPDLTMRDVYLLKLKHPIKFKRFEFDFPRWKEILSEGH